MSTVWQNTAGACSKSFPAAGLPLMGLLPPARPSALPASLPCAELFLAGGERLRQMTPCDGCRSLPCVERRLVAPFRAPPNPYRCVQVWSGVHCKKIGANRHPPAYAAETTTSLSPCSLSASPPKRVGASLVRDRDASREFFFCTTICIVCRCTYYYYCRTIISPFLQPSKMAVRLIIFFCRHNSL